MLFILYKVNNKPFSFKQIIHFVHTTTQTIISTEPSPVENQNPIVSVSDNPTINTVLSPVENQDITKGIIDRMDKNNAVLQDILNQPRISRDSFEVNTSPSPANNINNPTEQSFSNDEDSVMGSIIGKIQYANNPEPLPHSPEEIEQALMPIVLSSKILGQKLVEKMKANDIAVEESEESEIRQEALYFRAKEFLASFSITNRAVKLALVLTVGYTIYNIIRFRQLPLGGFIKSMLFDNPNNNALSSLPNPVNNITINIPSPSVPNLPANDIAPMLAKTETFLSTFIQKHPYLTGVIVSGGYVIIKLMAKKR